MNAVECLIANSINIARRKRREMLRPEHGFTVDCVCGNDLCIEPEHLELRRWTSIGGKFADLMTKISALAIDESIDLPDEKNTTAFRCNLASAAHRTKFIVRSQPKGGVRIIRVGTWGGEMTEKHYPVLTYKKAAPVYSSRCPWLGYLAHVSMAARDVPKYEHCKARGCVYPANGNGQGLCRHHFHFFDFSVSRLGRHIDMEDIYGDDKQAPRFYVSWFWKHQSESLKFEQGGKTSWWKERVESVEKWVGANLDKRMRETCKEKVPYRTKTEADVILKHKHPKPARGAESIESYRCTDCGRWHIGNTRTVFSMMAAARVNMGISIPGLHRGASGFHNGKSPSNRIARSVKASQRARWKSAVEHRIGSKRTPSKPEKRWSREALEIEADKILGAAGFFESQKYYFEDAPKASPVSYMVTEPDFTDEQEREQLIAGIENREFEQIFGT